MPPIRIYSLPTPKKYAKNIYKKTVYSKPKLIYIYFNYHFIRSFWFQRKTSNLSNGRTNFTNGSLWTVIRLSVTTLLVTLFNLPIWRVANLWEAPFFLLHFALFRAIVTLEAFFVYFFCVFSQRNHKIVDICFWSCCSEMKCGVEFCYSWNVSEFGRKVGNRVFWH